jgi:hypothetical protein
MKITRKLKVLVLALLLTIGVSGAAVGITYAAQNSSSEASDTETNDDKATPANQTSAAIQDGETND